MQLNVFTVEKKPLGSGRRDLPRIHQRLQAKLRLEPSPSDSPMSLQFTLFLVIFFR